MLDISVKISAFLRGIIYLTALGLSCSMWGLFSLPGIEPGPPTLGAWSLSHWTTREVPTPVFLLGEFPWTEESGGLQSMGLQRVGQD